MTIISKKCQFKFSALFENQAVNWLIIEKGMWCSGKQRLVEGIRDATIKTVVREKETAKSYGDQSYLYGTIICPAYVE